MAVGNVESISQYESAEQQNITTKVVREWTSKNTNRVRRWEGQIL